MSKKIKDDYKIAFIRGATTASGNSVREIEVAVVELIDELITRNDLIKTNILSIIFTATKDLNACFPASIARKFNGLDSVAFIDCQQMYVSNDVDFCIRIMAQVLLPPNYAIKHPYLRGAAKLRTDRC
jgi:chorismate mutase